MRPLTTDEVLQVWDETLDRPIPVKTLRLLAKACAVTNPDQVMHLSIGDRDARLLRIREWMFGHTLRNKANCPKCSDTIEWESNTNTLHLQSFSPSLSVKNSLLEKDGYLIKFRLPDSFDLIQITGTQLNEDIYQRIISKCIFSITKDNEDCSTNDLPISIWEALNDRMSEEDPQADIRMQLICPGCNHYWEMYFDIGVYLWTEIDNWVKRILEEVYLLAKAFSWSEKEILTMSPHRRRLYLEMIQK